MQTAWYFDILWGTSQSHQTDQGNSEKTDGKPVQINIDELVAIPPD